MKPQTSARFALKPIALGAGLLAASVFLAACSGDGTSTAANAWMSSASIAAQDAASTDAAKEPRPTSAPSN